MQNRDRTTDSETNNLDVTLLRQVNSQSLQFSYYAADHEFLVSQVMRNVGHQLDYDRTSLLYHSIADIKQDMFNRVLNTINSELTRLHLRMSPISKSMLPQPSEINMWNFPDVHENFMTNPEKAALSLRKIFFEKIYATDATLDRLKYGSWLLCGTSASLTAYQIATSKNRVEELEHQATILGGGMTAGYSAGLASLPYCRFVGVWAPACVAGASFVGGILGTEAAEQLWQYGKSWHLGDRLLITVPRFSFINNARAAEVSSDYSQLSPHSFTLSNPFSFSSNPRNRMTPIRDNFFSEFSRLNSQEIPRHALQQIKRKLLESYHDATLSRDDIRRTEQFLREMHLPFELSPNPNENRVMYRMISDGLVQYEQYASNQDAVLRFSAAHDVFGFFGAVGRVFDSQALYTGCFIGQVGASTVLGVGQLTGSFGFTQVTGLSVVFPVLTLSTVAFSVLGFLNSLDEEPNDGLIQALTIFHDQLSSQIRSFYEFERYRAERQEKLVVSGFTQTFQRLKMMHDIIVTALQFIQYKHEKNIQRLELALEDISSEVDKLRQENLLSSFRHVMAIVELNKHLPDNELIQVLQILETYLYMESSNPAFTQTIGNRRVTADDFSPAKIEKYLSKDPLIILGYLYQYYNHLLGLNENIPKKIANPILYLKVLNIYMEVIYNNIDSPEMKRITVDKVRKLILPAQNTNDFFDLIRKEKFVNKSTSEFEESILNLKKYIKENVMNNLEKHFGHSPKFSPLNTLARPFQTNPLKTRETYIESPRENKESPVSQIVTIGASRNILTSMKVDAAIVYENMMSSGDPLAAEHILAERLGLANITMRFWAEYNSEFEYIHYHMRGIFIPRDNATNSLDFVDWTGGAKLAATELRTVDSGAEASARHNTAMLERHFASIGMYSLSAHGRNYYRNPNAQGHADVRDFKKFRLQIEQKIFEIRDSFPDNYLDVASPEHEEFSRLVVNINKFKRTLAVYLYLSGFQYEFKDIEDHYEQFKKEISQQVQYIANNPLNHVYHHPVELVLQTRLKFLNLTGQLISEKSHEDDEPGPADTAATPPSPSLFSFQFAHAQTLSTSEIVYRHRLAEIPCALPEIDEPSGTAVVPANICYASYSENNEELLQEHSLLETASISAMHAGVHGGLRGAATVAAEVATSKGCSQRAADCIKKAVYYGSYFLWSLGARAQESQEPTYMDAVYSAAADTLQLAVANAMLNATSNLLKNIGLEKCASWVPFSIFAKSAIQNGALATSAAVLTGTAVQAIVEGNMTPR